MHVSRRRGWGGGGGERGRRRGRGRGRGSWSRGLRGQAPRVSHSINKSSGRITRNKPRPFVVRGRERSEKELKDEEGGGGGQGGVGGGGDTGGLGRGVVGGDDWGRRGEGGRTNKTRRRH